MKDYWERIEDWIATACLGREITLGKKASSAEIKELEILIGAKLPSDFTQFYKIHNGQVYNDSYEDLIDGEELLSLERIAEEWTIWKDLKDSGDFDDYASLPDEGIKNDWWNPLWIPFTSDGAGNHLCIDLDPDKGGIKGQVIRMWHDGASRDRIAISFTAFIDSFISEKDSIAPLIIGEDSSMDGVLDDVLSKHKERIFAESVKEIKKYPSLKRMETLYAIHRLASWLYVVDDKELSLKMSSFITSLPFTSKEVAIWDCIKAALTREYVIYSDLGQSEMSEHCQQRIAKEYDAMDEKKARISKRILSRRFNGSGLNEDKIAEARQANNLESEVYLRFRDFVELSYILVMGGSEVYPITKVKELIADELSFLKENIALVKY